MLHLPSISHIMNNIFKKENVDDGKIRTKVLYNTRYNLIILVSYSSPYFYTVIEFLEAINNIGSLKIHLAHSAKEKELSSEEQEEFDKKKVEIIDNRYYIIISGKPEDYAKLYEVCNLSNEILELMMDDFYNNCSSVYFDRLIGYGILNLGKFRFQNIVPTTYNKTSTIKYFVNGFDGIIYIDDYDYISKTIPEPFIMMDIVDIINIYKDNENKPGTPGEIFYNLKQYPKYINNLDKNGMSYKACIARMAKLMKYVYPYFIPLDNITLQDLDMLNMPVFMREDITDLLEGNVPIEKLDEIFQQQYDRFVQPTADAIEYENIDEEIPLNEESENIRKEDILTDDSD